MKMINIYAVISSAGSYDDYHEFVEKCFTNKDTATEYAKKIDESHVHTSKISEEIMKDVDNHFYEDCVNPQVKSFCKANNIPTNEDVYKGAERTEKQMNQIYDLVDKIEERYDEWCIKYLTEHYPEYTEQDYWDYLEVVDHTLYEWHDCKIKEFELVVDDEFKI